MFEINGIGLWFWLLAGIGTVTTLHFFYGVYLGLANAQKEKRKLEMKVFKFDPLRGDPHWCYGRSCSEHPRWKQDAFGE